MFYLREDFKGVLLTYATEMMPLLDKLMRKSEFKEQWEEVKEETIKECRTICEDMEDVNYSNDLSLKGKLAQLDKDIEKAQEERQIEIMAHRGRQNLFIISLPLLIGILNI